MLRNSADNLVTEVINICYFMRGSIQYDQVFMKTPYERGKMKEFIEARLEKESKKMFPIY